MRTSELKLPEPSEIRERIASVKQDNCRHCLEAVYLCAARISEIVGHSTPGDTTQAIGSKGSEASLDNYEGHEVVLFWLRTEKREDHFVRMIALPTEYEPWAKPLYEYYHSKGDRIVFPFTRQPMWKYARRLFSPLKYPIYRYTRKDAQNKKIPVPKHWKPFGLHALRHLRATELNHFYHFGAEDLAAYCGWKLSTAVPAISPVMERYIDLNWQQYIRKLFKPRTQLSVMPGAT